MAAEEVMKNNELKNRNTTDLSDDHSNACNIDDIVPGSIIDKKMNAGDIAQNHGYFSCSDILLQKLFAALDDPDPEAFKIPMRAIAETPEAKLFWAACKAEARSKFESVPLTTDHHRVATCYMHR